MLPYSVLDTYNFVRVCTKVLVVNVLYRSITFLLSIQFESNSLSRVRDDEY